MPSYEFVAGDTGSVLQVTCKDSAGVVINLTGKTATLRWKNAAGSLQTAAMTVAAPASAGIVTYTFSTAELTAGLTEMEVRIADTAAGTYVTQTDIFTIPVRAPLA